MTALTPRMVLAVDDEGAVVAIGPIGKDETIEQIRDLIEARGWENYGVVTRMSAENFKQDCKAGAR